MSSLAPLASMAFTASTVSPDFLAALERAGHQADQAAAYGTIIQQLQVGCRSFAADTSATADAILAASLGVVDTRRLMDQVTGALARHLQQAGEADACASAGRHILGSMQCSPAVSSLLEQAAALREVIASAHEAGGDFAAAARTLGEIALDGSSRRVDDATKAAVWVRIVRDYLEADDGDAAEAYLNRLKNVMQAVRADGEMALHFGLSAARVHDHRRRFLAAARAYHDVSLDPCLAEDERTHTLRMAVRCAVLAPAGPPRNRVLGRLYKDDRAASRLAGPDLAMLENMFLDRLLDAAEVGRFALGLAPHQLAATADGTTVLARAVVEHNLLAASRLYTSLGLDALAALLGLDAARTEETTARMIEQGRLRASVDQTDGLVTFLPADGDITAGREICRWDACVHHLAESVEQLSDALQGEYPAFVAQMAAAAT